MLPTRIADLFAMLVSPELTKLDDELAREMEKIARAAAAKGSLASGNTLVAVVERAAVSLDTRAQFAWEALRRACDAYRLVINSNVADAVLTVVQSFVATEESKSVALLRASAAFRSI